MYNIGEINIRVNNTAEIGNKSCHKFWIYYWIEYWIALVFYFFPERYKLFAPHRKFSSNIFVHLSLEHEMW